MRRGFILAAAPGALLLGCCCAWAVVDRLVRMQPTRRWVTG